MASGRHMPLAGAPVDLRPVETSSSPFPPSRTPATRARLGPASLCAVPTHHAHLGFPLSSSQLILYQAAESGPAFLPHLPSRLSPRPAALEPHCPLSPLDRAARVPASGPAHWPWPATLLVVGGAFPNGPTPLPHPALAESGVPFPVCPLVCHHCAPVPSPTPLICLVRLR